MMVVIADDLTGAAEIGGLALKYGLMAEITTTVNLHSRADLLIIDGDPSTNINDIQKVQYAFRDGVGYNSRKLFDSVRGKVGFI